MSRALAMSDKVALDLRNTPDLSQKCPARLTAFAEMPHFTQGDEMSYNKPLIKPGSRPITASTGATEGISLQSWPDQANPRILDSR